MNSSRSPSLPALSDRGRGLADIKGKDPMDRRVEVEKKERYGQALREQMAMNAESRRNRSEHDAPETPIGALHTSAGFYTAAGGSPGYGAGGGSLGMSETHHPSGDAGMGGFTHGPPPLPPGPASRHIASPTRTDIIGSGGGLWGTADKVAQVQDIMHQRLNAVQEDQQKMWQRVQAWMAEQSTAATRLAEEAIQRQLEAARASHAEELRRAMEQVGAAQRECTAQAHRVEGLAGDFHALRLAVERLQAELGQHSGQLEVHSVEIERLKHAHEECARFRAEMQRMQREVGDELAKLRAEQREESKHAREQLQRQAGDIDRLRAERQEDARAVADLANQQRAVNDAMGQIRSDFQDLAGKVASVPGLIKKLRDELPRLAARAAQEALEGMRPPEPVQKTVVPVPVCPPEVSEEAYAVLRNGLDELHELPALRNVVGRAAACNVCISGSQQISNKHASVDFGSEGRVLIKDLGSRNGTFLNDHRVPYDAGLVLQSGDALRLGTDGPTYVFEYGPAYYARWPHEPERVQDRYSTAQVRGRTGR